MSRLVVHTANKIIPVEKHLYGIFLEDINRAADGGLYPELIRNRTFEDSIPPLDCITKENDYAVVTQSGWHDEFNHGEGLTRWIKENEIPYTPIPGWYSQQTFIDLDRNDTLNVHRQAALAVHFKENGRIYNTGFCGIPQKNGASYDFYMFAKSNQPIELVISLKEGERLYATQTLQVVGDEYNRYDIHFTSKGDTKNARLEINCKQEATLKIGFISLMPTDTYNNHGLRKDIVEKLRDLKPTFFRFPGGCIVEGISPSTVMKFSNTVGPVWERPGQLLMWHYRTYNGLGFHEYLQLCEDLDMEPLYVLNCGMTCQARKSVLLEGVELDNMIQDTLDAIEYAVGSVTSKWGMLRAEMGHPQPFRMNFVEIGNENSGPDYELRYKKCYEAIKEQYPWIQCIANTHVEQIGLPVEIVDEHYYNTTEYFAEHTKMFEQYDRKGPQIFLGEVAVVRGYVGQLYGALGEAAFFTGVEKNQDIVTFASYAPLLENVNYQAWFPNLIRFNQLHSYGIPSYYVWKLFGTYRGDFIVDTKEETNRITRPVKGMASLLSTQQIQFKNAKWNSECTCIRRTIMGKISQDEDSYVVEHPSEEQKNDAKRYYGVNPEESFVVFGEEEDTIGTFEVEILLREQHELNLGIFTSRIPKEVYKSDETNPPKEWNPEKVKPLIWKINSGISSLVEREYPNEIILASANEFPWNVDSYNHFSYSTDGVQLKLYVNHVLVHDIEIPSFPSLSTVVSDNQHEVIIKLVNMSPDEDKVAIQLDCKVKDEYKAYLLTGEQTAMNSFESPEHVCDQEYILHGASQQFEYQAPPFSLSVLVLEKAEMQKGGNNNEPF